MARTLGETKGRALMTSKSPEWLPDPLSRYEHRYWDGDEWTAHVSNAGQPEVDPLGIAPSEEPPETVPPIPAARPEPEPAPADIGPRELHAKGVTGTVQVDDHFVTIKRKGAVAKMNYGWTRGEKRIPIDAIGAVQYKKAGISRGYIQFTLAGGNESTGGVMAASQDENSVTFASGHESEFMAIRDHIEQRIAARQTAGRAPSAPTLATPATAPALASVANELARARRAARRRDPDRGGVRGAEGTAAQLARVAAVHRSTLRAIRAIGPRRCRARSPLPRHIDRMLTPTSPRSAFTSGKTPARRLHECLTIDAFDAQ